MSSRLIIVTFSLTLLLTARPASAEPHEGLLVRVTPGVASAAASATVDDTDYALKGGAGRLGIVGGWSLSPRLVLTAELLAAGADGVCVNLGGDVRVSGVPPIPPSWQVDLDSALAPSRTFHLGEGAVATSTRRSGRAIFAPIAPGTVQAMVDRPLEIRQVFGSYVGYSRAIHIFSAPVSTSTMSSRRSAALVSAIPSMMN